MGKDELIVIVPAAGAGKRLGWGLIRPLLC